MHDPVKKEYKSGKKKSAETEKKAINAVKKADERMVNMVEKAKEIIGEKIGGDLLLGDEKEEFPRKFEPNFEGKWAVLVEFEGNFLPEK